LSIVLYILIVVPLQDQSLGLAITVSDICQLIERVQLFFGIRDIYIMYLTSCRH